MGQTSSIEGIQVEEPNINDNPLSLSTKTILTGVTFGAALPIAQRAGKLCKISCATPYLSSLFGAASVGVISAFSVQIVRQVEKLLIPDFPETKDKDRFFQFVVPALIGIISFKTLGGRFQQILPSDVRFPGVYAKIYLPATGAGARYAHKSEKYILKLLYKQFGCHHCGKRTGESIADHMPPNVVHWKSRRVIKATQKYYPQCISCMKVQSGALRHGLNPFVLHKKSGWPEPYVFSGFLLAALQPDIDDLKDELDSLLNKDEYRVGRLYNTFKSMFCEVDQ